VAWWATLALGLLCQTTLFPHVFSPAWAPDLTRPLVLWAAVTGVPRGSAFLAFGAGLSLDAASGSPLGFGAALRLLLYGLARPLRGVFFDDHPLLLFPLALLGTLADAAGAWALSQIALPTPLPLDSVAGVWWHQALGDLVAVPLLFLLLEVASGRRSGPRLAP
jgi:rod shape-determining protein MreD